MEAMYGYGIVIVCMLILLAITVMFVQNNIFNNILKGYWKSDANFLKKNNISLFEMAIGPYQSSSCSVYMIMKDNNNGVILNETNEITMVSKIFNPFSRQRKYNILFNHNVGNNNESNDISFDDIMPLKLNMIFDPIAGFLTLYDGDTVYAEMYRDNELSDIDTS